MTEISNDRKVIKLKFKSTVTHDISDIDNLFPKKPEAKLRLKLTRKDKNSPNFSVNKFIKNQLITGQSLSNLPELWNKYQKMDSNSLIIKNHDLDYDIFCHIADPIIDTYKSYKLEIVPITSNRPLPNNNYKELIL